MLEELCFAMGSLAVKSRRHHERYKEARHARENSRRNIYSLNLINKVDVHEETFIAPNKGQRGNNKNRTLVDQIEETVEGGSGEKVP
jgi:hypothetical protein